MSKKLQPKLAIPSRNKPSTGTSKSLFGKYVPKNEKMTLLLLRS